MRKQKKKEKLRIAMFGQKRFPSREGGVEVVVGELVTRMVRRGHTVTCYNRAGHHVSEKEFSGENASLYQNIRIQHVPTIQRKGAAAITSSFFAACACALGSYDIVHIHAEGPAAFCWLPKLFGKRVIVTVHGLDHKREKWNSLASAFILAGEKSAVRFADEIIVLSQGVQKYFKDTYGKETVFIPNGVNRPEKRSADLIAREYGLKKDGYILFLGRLVPEKGVHRLMEAFRELDTDKKLVIAGEASDTGKYVEELEKRARGDKRVQFTGFVQGQVLNELYSNAYVYVLPSSLEGMPLSLLEAMSYGNCCLVSDIAECVEVVEDKAPVFHNGDTEDLKKKLQMLCDRPDEVKRYQSEAADYVCGKYCWEDVTDRTLEVYRGAQQTL